MDDSYVITEARGFERYATLGKPASMPIGETFEKEPVYVARSHVDCPSLFVLTKGVRTKEIRRQLPDGAVLDGENPPTTDVGYWRYNAYRGTRVEVARVDPTQPPELSNLRVESQMIAPPAPVRHKP